MSVPDFPALLRASLDPSSRREAEHRLKELAGAPVFLPTLLQFVVGSGGTVGGVAAVDRSIRLAGAVYLKNVVKRNWVDVRAIPSLCALRICSDRISCWL